MYFQNHKRRNKRLKMATKELTRNILEFICQNKPTDAKNLLVENFNTSLNERKRGTKAALEGILYIHNKNKDLIYSDNEIKKMVKAINGMSKSISVDEFDKGFLDVWKENMKILRTNRKNEESVIENPTEKE
tara:strand:- start:345 stop:740 length:396 start_codon:yes stop_codon:yes gene_type:complete